MSGFKDLDIDKREKMEIKSKKDIPLSYIPITLSTNGKLGVPKVVHCRNFNTEDLLTLSMMANSILPERVLTVLNSLIYEDVDVSTWPDKSIIELLVSIYSNYFTPIFFQIPFPWNDEDLQWLRANEQEDKAIQLEKKIWIPRIDLDLRTAVSIDTLEMDVKDTVTIKKKGNGGIEFSAKFRAYPAYGDVLVLRKEVQDRFKEVESKYEKIKKLVNMYSTFLDQDKDITELPEMNMDEYMEWQTFELTKDIYVADATQALYLLEFNGEDLSQLTINDRIKYMKMPEFNIHVSSKLDKHFESLKFGINPMIKVKNPITGQVSVRPYTFRPSDIVQAVQSAEFDGYDISYE